MGKTAQTVVNLSKSVETGHSDVIVGVVVEPAVTAQTIAERYADVSRVGLLAKVIYTASAAFDGVSGASKDHRDLTGKMTPDGYATAVQLKGGQISRPTVSRHLNTYDALRDKDPKLAEILPTRVNLDPTGGNGQTVENLIKAVMTYFGGQYGPDSYTAREQAELAHRAVQPTPKDKKDAPDKRDARNLGGTDASNNPKTTKTDKTVKTDTKTVTVSNVADRVETGKKFASLEELDKEIERVENVLADLNAQRAAFLDESDI